MTYRITLYKDQDAKRVIVTANTEREARELAATQNPGYTVRWTREHADFTSLKPEQIQVCALLAYLCFTLSECENPNVKECQIDTANWACQLLGVPPDVRDRIKSGFIKGLPNLGRMSGGEFKRDYFFPFED